MNELNERKVGDGWPAASDGMDPNDWGFPRPTAEGGWWERTERGQGEDRWLARELMALPPAVRAAVATRERRFHRESLARMLAVEAEEELFLPGGDARPAAATAVAIAGVLLTGDAVSTRPLAALAWWLLGKGLLTSGHCRLALQAFGSIRPLLAGGCSAEGALMSVGVAQACEDRGFMDAATAHWLGASVVFHRVGAAQPAAACQALLGFHLIECGDHENAAQALGNAATLLEPASAPALAARVRLGLAESRTAMGETDAAEEALAAARGLYSLDGSAAETAARLWWEGRIAASGMRDDEAEQRLNAARAILQMYGCLDERVRVTWDQLALRLDSAGNAEVGRLVAGLRESSPVGERWAATFEGAARRSAAGDGYRVRMEMAGRLRRLRSGGGPAGARLTVPSRVLGDQVMRCRRSAAMGGARN